MATVIQTNEPLPEVSVDNEDCLYEIVGGKRVEVPPMSIYAAYVASLIAGQLFAFCKNAKLGRVITEGLFVIDEVEFLHRRPDVAFVSYKRWSEGKNIPQETNAWDVIPDLVVEVISPTDRAEDVLAKTMEYLQAKVRQVWVVYPRQEILHVYDSLTSIAVFQKQDLLTSNEIFPGLQIPLGEVFPSTK